MTQSVKNIPAMREMQVQSLGWEDPLEKVLAIHSSILSEESHGLRNLAGYGSYGHKESERTEATEHASKYINSTDSRDIILSTKVRLVKATVFPVVMCGCESWTIKKAECRRIDAFELWCWRRLLRVPWTARRSNQSILKKISPGCSVEGLMLKLKLQYFGHLM